MQHGGDTYQLRAATTTFAPGVTSAWSFEVIGPRGAPSSYRMQHERELHLIVVRDDLSTFSHLHPTHDDAGGWSVELTLPFAGSYTAFADVAPDEAAATTLKLSLQADGDWEPDPAPAPSRACEVDGYEVELRGDVVAGVGSEINFTVTKNGTPVEPDTYLGAAGHLVALRSGDLEYLHVHPLETDEPGDIPFMMHAPSRGLYRLFLQFLHGGQVRTADFTLEVGPAASDAPEPAHSSIHPPPGDSVR